ncbi:MAG: hypothetical protein AOA65_0946 [Candidatus Bathyarchaeota archaeon BA1]|nr:MAG: hypothetical protein AOA65_0946 [Candidatus Bathyarchaeota archaeon BA1]
MAEDGLENDPTKNCITSCEVKTMPECALCGKNYAEAGVHTSSGFRYVCRVCAQQVAELYERRYR